MSHQGYGQGQQGRQGGQGDPWAASGQGAPQWQDPRAPQPPYQQYGPPPGYQPQHAPQPPRRRKPHRGLRILAWGSVAFLGLIVLVVALSPKNSTPSASSSAPASAPPAHPGAKSSASCKLKTTFDYIERDDYPGASIMASEIGNVDFVNCTDSLSDFRATAGQADGECTTIALASDNKGYDVDAVPAPPLKHVIMSAGPGC